MDTTVREGVPCRASHPTPEGGGFLAVPLYREEGCEGEAPSPGCVAPRFCGGWKRGVEGTRDPLGGRTFSTGGEER